MKRSTDKKEVKQSKLRLKKEPLRKLSSEELSILVGGKAQLIDCCCGGGTPSV